MEFEARKNSFNGEVEPCQTRLTAPQQWWVSKGVNMIFFSQRNCTEQNAASTISNKNHKF
jgi:hypothetical protein